MISYFRFSLLSVLAFFFFFSSLVHSSTHFLFSYIMSTLLTISSYLTIITSLSLASTHIHLSYIIMWCCYLFYTVLPFFTGLLAQLFCRSSSSFQLLFFLFYLIFLLLIFVFRFQFVEHRIHWDFPPYLFVRFIYTHHQINNFILNSTECGSIHIRIYYLDIFKFIHSYLTRLLFFDAFFFFFYVGWFVRSFFLFSFFMP